MPLIANVHHASSAESNARLKPARKLEACAKRTVRELWGVDGLVPAKLSASKIRGRLLETRSVASATWEELVEYLQNLHDIVQNINQCAKDVKEIQNRPWCVIRWMKMIQLNHLQLTIEAECQRQLFEGIKEFCEIRETVICSSACCTTHTATRRSVIRNSSYEISMWGVVPFQSFEFELH
ncbi:hypothetical protein B0H14DRAFT_2634908 [Mycena olivaceomarginata]|nr:hypothetical protein B0H14DRAFT_2634908 [Mycena olivaceomarginata]